MDIIGSGFGGRNLLPFITLDNEFFYKLQEIRQAIIKDTYPPGLPIAGSSCLFCSKDDANLTLERGRLTQGRLFDRVVVMMSDNIMHNKY